MIRKLDEMKQNAKRRKLNRDAGGVPTAQQTGPSPQPLAPSNVSTPSSTNQLQSQSNAPGLPIRITVPGLSSSTSPSFPTTATASFAPPDLWAEALQTLSTKEQAAIRSLIPPPSNPTQPPSDVVGELCALAEKKRAECEKRGWKFEYKGQQVILRDVANKVIIWLDKFKAVGDVAVNYDPSHLALPWAGVRFILQAAVVENQQMGDLLVGTEKVTCLMSRGMIYENVYLHVKHGTNPDRAVNNLQDALVKLYTKVLQFLAGANRLYNKSTVSRAIHAILNPDEVRSFIQDCQSLEDRVDIEASNCERMYTHEALSGLGKQMKQLRQLLNDINKPIVRTDPGIAALWDRSNSNEHSKILLWTSDIPYEENHKTAKEGRAKDTGQWLLMHEKYSQWRNSSASMILWLHGIPGAGKTKLASTVVDDILHDLSGRNDEAVAYFYCDRNQANRKDPVSVLRSFVRQLSTTRPGNAMLPPLLLLYQQKRQTGFASGSLDINECEDLLLEYVKIYPHTILILDALDECDHRTRKHLIAALDRIVGSSSKPIKVFISSRPDLDIRDRFETGPNVGVQATDNQNDIARFVDAQLGEHEKGRKKLSVKLKEDIRNTLLEKSQGMFQWASLQITQILELDREKDIRLRLGRLPEDLTKAYDEVWASMQTKPGSSFEVAERAFMWVMCSREPLSPELLVAAVCQDPETEDTNQVDVDIDYVLAACSNLLVVDSQLSLCRFSHLSVQEYIETHRLKPVQAEDVVARVCLRLLCDDSINKSSIEPAEWSDEEPDQYKSDEELHQDENIEKRVEKLLNYARENWPEHVQNCEEAEDVKQLSALLMNFLGSVNESGAAYRAWHATLAETSILPYRTSPSSSASLAICHFGFYRVLSVWWDVGPIDTNQCNRDGASLLALSARNGSLPICRRLIELGASVNPQKPCEDWNGHALQGAVKNGHEKVVELLLDNGADIDAHSANNNPALQLAASCGHQDIVELLLKRGADANVMAEGSYSGLIMATIKAYEGIVATLLKYGARVDIRGYNNETALQVASELGYEDIVELLLENGADVNAQGELEETALHLASRRGLETIVEQLLEKAADVHALNRYKITALQEASANGLYGMVEVLRNNGADTNVRGGPFGNALILAVRDKNWQVAKLLIDKRADVNFQDESRGTALLVASGLCWEEPLELIEFLVKKGANVHARNWQNRTALQMASERGHTETIRLLLDWGAEDVMAGSP